MNSMSVFRAPERIAYGPAPSQFFETWVPDAPGPWGVLLIHGGLWLSRYGLSQMDPLCRELGHQGYRVANLEYRRVDEPGGGWPGTFEDIREGFQAICHSAPSQKWIVAGHSSGGHLALWLGGESALPLGILAMAPVADLESPRLPALCLEPIKALMGGHGDALPQANPAKRAPRTRQVILHGSGDELLPVELSREYHPPAGAPVEIQEAEGGHFDFLEPGSTLWQRTFQALARMAVHS